MLLIFSGLAVSGGGGGGGSVGVGSSTPLTYGTTQANRLYGGVVPPTRPPAPRGIPIPRGRSGGSR